jgi:hypothetical protein
MTTTLSQVGTFIGSSVKQINDTLSTKADQSSITGLNKFYEASSEANMLGLLGLIVGDFCIRTDTLNIHRLTALQASTLSNWKIIASAGGSSGVVGVEAARAIAAELVLTNNLASEVTARTTDTAAFKTSGVSAVGLLANLSTTNKTNLVAAINEVAAAAASGAGNIITSVLNTDFTLTSGALSLYHIPVISNAVATTPIYEIGSSVTSIAFTWNRNKAVTSQTIQENQFGSSPVSIGSTLYAYTLTTSAITASTSYTLSCGDGQNTATTNIPVLFQPKIYWGISTLTSLTSSQIVGLGNSAFATVAAKSATFNCTGNKYIYFAYPVSFTAISSVTVNGLNFTDYTVTTVGVVNASGYTQNYSVIRFTNLQTGSAISVSWQ